MTIFRIRAVLCAIFCTSLLVGSANAQSSRFNDGLPPYEDDMLRLISIVGSLEFLHPLCNRQAVGVWKDQMANLLEAEDPVPARRARMMATYNKAYILLQQVHKTCTPTAELILQKYETEAVELTRNMATTYRPAPQEPVAEAPAADGDANTIAQ